MTAYWPAVLFAVRIVDTSRSKRCWFSRNSINTSLAPYIDPCAVFTSSIYRCGISRPMLVQMAF